MTIYDHVLFVGAVMPGVIILFLIVYLPFNVVRPNASWRRRIVSLVVLNGLSFLLMLANLDGWSFLDLQFVLVLLLDVSFVFAAIAARGK